MKRKAKSLLISFLLLFAMLFGAFAFNTNTAKADEALTVENSTLNVESIRIELPIPEIGKPVSYTDFTKVGENAEDYTFGIYYWQNNSTGKMEEGDVFEIDYKYTLRFYFDFNEGYFTTPHTIEVYINNEKVTTVENYTSGTIYRTKDYYNLISITVNVENGTLYHNGEPTDETQFFAGTELTVVANEALYPDKHFLLDFQCKHSYKSL